MGGGGEQSSYFIFIVKVVPTGFVDRMSGYGVKRIKDHSKVFVLNKKRDEVTINQNGDYLERSRFGD